MSFVFDPGSPGFVPFDVWVFVRFVFAAVFVAVFGWGVAGFWLAFG